MWSMWNAPSERCDDGELEICEDCAARWNQACEEWRETNRAEEPPVSCLAFEDPEVANK